MIVTQNATELILLVKLVDSVGDPITGISESGVVMESLSYGDATWQTVTLVAGTAGTFVSNGWVELGSGEYQFCPANSLVVSGRDTRFRATVGANPVQYGFINASGFGNTSAAAQSAIEVGLLVLETKRQKGSTTPLTIVWETANLETLELERWTGAAWETFVGNSLTVDSSDSDGYRYISGDLSSLFGTLGDIVRLRVVGDGIKTQDLFVTVILGEDVIQDAYTQAAIAAKNVQT